MNEYLLRSTKPSARRLPMTRIRINRIIDVILSAGFLALVGCAPKPMISYSTDTPPLILAPAAMADCMDGRARFREIFCAVTEQHGREFPDYRPCPEALVRLANEAKPTNAPVNLSKSHSGLKVLVVLGLGAKCIEKFIDYKMTVIAHLSSLGYKTGIIAVEALSSSARNAGIIRQTVMAMPPESEDERVILIGYSKGAPDILEAVATYPDLQQRVAAVVSVAGAVGGSPLANTTNQSTVNLFQHFPEAECELGDEGALESLKPEVRQKWLAEHPLPESIRYYSVVTYPDEAHISSLLKSSHKKLSQIDSRNDSQVIFYDQVIPGSVLLGYLNADHWAVAVPLNRMQSFLVSSFVNKNAFPREVLAEAVVRFVEEDLNSNSR